MRLFAFAFLAGTAALQCAASLPDFPWHVAGLVALVLAAIAPRGARVALLVVAGAFAGFGLAAWRAEARLSESLPLAMEGEDIAVTGIVAGLPQLNAGSTRFLFEVEKSDPPVVPRMISLAWYAQRGKTGDRPRFPTESATGRSSGKTWSVPGFPPSLVAGDRWAFTVRLRRPRGLANPHTFDFEPWALERDIRASGSVRDKEGATRLDRVEGWPYTLHRWRGEIRDGMIARLGEARLRGVLVALAIGDQDSISAGDWEVFWRTGVGHLMSISGLHITMLAGLAFAAAFFLWVRVPALALRIPARKAAAVAGVAAAFAYTLMTGYAVPAQRTLVMLSVVAACVLADRHHSPSRVLALAALAVVLLDPWAVLSAGFWLSFGAVASIFYVMSLRTGPQGKLRGALLEQAAVTVVMLPMLVALFQQVSLVSPLANAFAIPLVSLGVVPLAIAGAFLPLPFLLDAAHTLMVWVMGPLEWLAASPLAMLESHAPAPWTVAVATIGALWLLGPRGVPMRSCGALWLAPMFAVMPPSPAQGEAWIDILDVGNGLAVVVRTARHALAYDAGPSWSADADSGNRILVPFLRGEGVARLDGLVISHADDDHSGGAMSVADAREPAWLLSPLAPDDPLQEAFAESIRCEAGQAWAWDGVRFEVMHPGPEIYDSPRRRKENDRGCVVKVSTRSASMLLTADVEARSESEMLARGEALGAEVMLVPHHGSKTSSTDAFVDAVAPHLGILSVGYRNRFHHPNEAVVARYRARGIALRRTDAEGALRVVLGSTGPPFAVASHYECAYWSERECRPRLP